MYYTIYKSLVIRFSIRCFVCCFPPPPSLCCISLFAIRCRKQEKANHYTFKSHGFPPSSCVMLKDKSRIKELQ
jgi:hypothetical protein